MNINYVGLCRGDGKMYLKAVVNHSDFPDCSFSLIASTKTGSPLPSKLYVLEKESDSINSSLVLVLPIISVTQSISVEMLDSTGKQIAVNTRKINAEQAKWESRINYRINRSLTRQIRSFDEMDPYSQSDIRVNSIIAGHTHNVVRGSIALPETPNCDYFIQVLDSKGTSVQTAVSITGEATVSMIEYPNVMRKTIQFSIDMPTNIDECIIDFKCSSNSEYDNFTVLEQAIFKEMLLSNASARRLVDDSDSYYKWFAKNKATRGELKIQRDYAFSNKPLFSIITPLFNTPTNLLRDMIVSVLEQSYQNWELILVNASPENADISAVLSEYQDPRIKTYPSENTGGIAGNTNIGLEHCNGDFVCFFDHDDTLEPNALFEYAKEVERYPETDLLYCDEDHMNEEGDEIFAPFFKPSFSIDWLRYQNYITHFLCIRKTILDEMGSIDARYNGAQDLHMSLFASEHARRICGVQKILYHWRVCEGSTAKDPESKRYAHDAGKFAIQDHLDRCGVSGTVRDAQEMFNYWIDYDVTPYPLVSIVIPTKDNIALLDNCLDSIFKKTTYSNYEIILVENNSTEDETFSYYESILAKHDNVKVVTWENGFNFSGLINFGVGASSGEHILMLNNDTVVISPDWIEKMLGYSMQKEVGAVGAKLYFKDNTIQHAGVALIGGAAGHVNESLPKTDGGYFNTASIPQDYIAVTGACLMTSRNVFDELNGLDETFAVAYNDVDYCIRVYEAGYRTVFTPEAELYHLESASRGYEDISTAKQIRFKKEQALLQRTWAKYYVEGDPFWNRNLNSNSPYHKIS